MSKVFKALNKLAKWRTVFAGWQLGTRLDSDPECQAVRDHREATLLLRAEVTTLTDLLIKKNIINQQEFEYAIVEKSAQLEKDLEERFPGFHAEEYGMSIDTEKASETTKNWRP